MNNSSVVILVLVVLVVIAVVSPKKTRKAAEARYKPRALLTKNEVEFFHRLTQALPTEYISPKWRCLPSWIRLRRGNKDCWI